MRAITVAKGKNILIDTNVLINCGRDDFGADFRKILRTLSNNKNNLAISIISGFEIIKKFANDKKVVDYYFKLLNYITNISLDLKTMNSAAYLASEIYNNKDDHIKDNDCIIGATVAMNQESLLLTCDRKDFDSPFWDIVGRECIYWEDGERCRVENLYLLEFNHTKWKSKTGFAFDLDR